MNNLLIRLRNILTIIGGAYNPVLNQFPEQRTMYVIIGLFVVNTAFLSFLTMNFALHGLYPEKSKIGDWGLIGLVAGIWSFIIFSIDWGLIKTMDKTPQSSIQGSLKVVFIPTLLRIIVASLISFTISKPFEVRVAGDKLLPVIEANKQTYIQDIRIRRDSLNKKTLSQLEDQKRQDNDLRERLEKGPVGGLYVDKKSRLSTLEGKQSSAYKLLTDLRIQLVKESYKVCIKRDSLEKCIRYKTEYTTRGKEIQTQIPSTEKEINQLNGYVVDVSDDIDSLEKKHVEMLTPVVEQSGKSLLESMTFKDSIAKQLRRQDSIIVQKAEIGYDKSLLNQIQALETLAYEDKTNSIFWTKWLIFFVIWIVDLMPIFIKLLSKYSNYDKEIAQRESEWTLRNRQQKFRLRTEYKINKDLIQKMGRSQREIVKQNISNWETEEKQRARRNRGRVTNEEENES